MTNSCIAPLKNKRCCAFRSLCNHLSLLALSWSNEKKQRRDHSQTRGEIKRKGSAVALPEFAREQARGKRSHAGDKEINPQRAAADFMAYGIHYQSLEHRLGQRVIEAIYGHGDPDCQYGRGFSEDKISSCKNQISHRGNPASREVIAQPACWPGTERIGNVENEPQ